MCILSVAHVFPPMPHSFTRPVPFHFPVPGAAEYDHGLLDAGAHGGGGTRRAGAGAHIAAVPREVRKLRLLQYHTIQRSLF